MNPEPIIKERLTSHEGYLWDGANEYDNNLCSLPRKGKVIERKSFIRKFQ
jgi:hypothetical protein